MLLKESVKSLMATNKKKKSSYKELKIWNNRTKISMILRNSKKYWKKQKWCFPMWSKDLVKA